MKATEEKKKRFKRTESFEESGMQAGNGMQSGSGTQPESGTQSGNSRRKEEGEETAAESYYRQRRDYALQRALKLEKSLKKYRIVTCVLVLLLAASVTFIVYVMKSEKSTEEAFFNNIYITKETYRLTDNLEETVKKFSAEGYSASVVTINGYEYLALSTEISGEAVEICYQNEFPDKDKKDSAMKAFVRKDGKTVALPDEYDITAPEKNLPYIVTFTDGFQGLLYTDEEDGMLSELSLYDLKNMTKAGTIDMASTIRYYFGVECADDNKKLIQVSQSGVTYTFEAAEETYLTAKEQGGDILSLSEHFRYTIGEDSIDFTAFVSLGEDAYIGEYIGKITFTQDGFNMSSQKFEAYVYPEYEDPGNERIVTPRNAILTEKISIAGKNGGYYALELYNNVPMSEYDFSRVTSDESGVRSYIDENGEKASKFGIDVSYFQGNVDWEKAAEQGVEFAFPRIAYRGYSKGAIIKDECFDENVKNAKAAGLDVGVYIFSQAVTVEEGIEEANFILEEIKNLDIRGPIVFDTEYYDQPEDARGNLITRAERTAIARAFCETIEAAGYKPMIYANTRWLLLGINLDELAEYDVWYAYYGNDPILPYDFAIWQYSSEGQLDGIDNYVDMNIMLKDVFHEE